MASEILIATRSTDKLTEIQEILGATVRARLLTLRDVGIAESPAEAEIEAHATFMENAAAKARYFAELSGMAVIADDSGLCVDALAGGPGVRTKRFAIDERFVAPDTSGKDLDRANNRLLLDRLAATPGERRGAHYICAASFANPGGVVGTAIGTCTGVIGREEIGSGGFGYDPLFMLPDLHVTFAQLTRAQKNERSHRARAFRALAPCLK